MASILDALNKKPIADSPIVYEAIRVRGTVQGVGFRPTVYRLAQALGLRGEVGNDGAGVLMRVAGTRGQVDQLVLDLQTHCPPLAKIEAIIRTSIDPMPWQNFRIVPSVTGRVHTQISPDAATCQECKADLFDPTSRWYRYPFVNCTHCGPRISIIKALPYDRRRTSMGQFPMCSDCAQSYGDVNDRRFHAQPIACPVCGPKIWLEQSVSPPLLKGERGDLNLPDIACALLQQGEIVAIKGIGGIHLACDATNDIAVQRLRHAKHRYDKPFALMARDVATIEQYCQVTPPERDLLESTAAPIVLITDHRDTKGTKVSALASSIAPGLNTLGFMLPYSPLHHLILQDFDHPIILTSGNQSDEPQCIDNETCREKLARIADYFLLHDRDIVNRVDDSVVRVVEGETQILRRARGYAPSPIALPPGFEQISPILAMGSELKNTFCLFQSGEAILSQHLGDLEHASAFQAYQDTLNLYLQLFEHQPRAIAIDKHPEYLSSKLGREMARQANLPLYDIQHHHAHVAACMAENQLPLMTLPILGIALDGLGYGEDGTLWGGEFILATYHDYQRLAWFKPVPMLGGAQAIHQPWRNTYAHLLTAFSWEELRQCYPSLELIQFLGQLPCQVLDQMLAKQINSPLASSVGRLFDAVAAAVGICRDRASYEGQGAIVLEALVDTTTLGQQEPFAYPFEFRVDDQRCCLDPKPLWTELLQDLQTGIETRTIAARFHLGLAQAIVQTVTHLHQHHPFTQVALTGGVFQNLILTQQVSQRLTNQGFQVLTNHLVPPNDGGLALGQGAIAAARIMGG